MLRILFEQSHHDGCQIGRHVGAALRNGHRGFGEMLHEQRRRGAADERRLAAQHLIRHDAQGIEVAARVEIAIARSLLRAHVRRRPDGHARRRQPGRIATVRRRGARDPEVGDERAPIDAVEQDVVGLDVTMDDAARMCVGQRVGHFQQPAAHVFDG